LVTFALKANNEDVFVKAIADIGAGDIQEQEERRNLITMGCARFKREEVQEICRRLGVVVENQAVTRQ